MTDKISEIICKCELDNGYIFKNYFGFVSIKGRPVVTFNADKITAGNRTVDDKLYGSGYLHGDEINLIWNEIIPISKRKVSLTFDAVRLQGALGRIRKKDPARMFITQTRNFHDPYNFDSAGSCNDFTIFVSCGVGGDSREGVKSVPATRVDFVDTLIRIPDKLQCSMLVIPVRQYRSMIDSFTKCKKETIRMIFHTNSRVIDGREIKGNPGLVISTEGSSNCGHVLEKFGEVPEDSSSILPQINNIKIDESSVVRMTNPGLEIHKAVQPNEYLFDADKVSIFSKLSSMHNEGNVRIEYQYGRHIRIAHRFGAFGECEINLHNDHTS